MAGEPVYPLKVSDNHRYFVDQQGEPVFWLGTTQWQLFREYKLGDARLIVEKTKGKGFAFAQVMLLGVGDGTKPNVYGQKPWIDDNPLTPNEGYFTNVDAVVQIARQNNLVISMTMFHQRYRKFITLQNARAWAKWVAQRYKDVPTIVWSMTPEAKPEFAPIVRELAAGLREGDGGAHLITFKPDPAPHPAGFLHEEPWLDFSVMQVWKWIERIYPMVTQEYNLKPTNPWSWARAPTNTARNTGSRSPPSGSAGRPTTPTSPAPTTRTATTIAGGCCPLGKKPWTRRAPPSWAS